MQNVTACCDLPPRLAGHLLHFMSDLMHPVESLRKAQRGFAWLAAERRVACIGTGLKKMSVVGPLRVHSRGSRRILSSFPAERLQEGRRAGAKNGGAAFLSRSPTLILGSFWQGPLAILEKSRSSPASKRLCTGLFRPGSFGPFE